MANLTEAEEKRLNRSKIYWAERAEKAQEAITSKGIKETEEQLVKYYVEAQNKIIGQFEQIYNKVIASIDDGREPTPADLYKLNSYWKMQGQLSAELQKLGNKQAALLSKKFVEQWSAIYEALAMKNDLYFAKADKKLAEQMINAIWCADGKSWSSRIWTNTSRLQETLNNSLIECIVTGKKTTDLKNLLQERFNVSYSAADSIVRTEMAHIQTEAAKKRYEDYGIKEVQIWADEDERRCKVCGKLHETKYPIGAKVPIPAHPRCRCCIIPVVDD